MLGLQAAVFLLKASRSVGLRVSESHRKVRLLIPHPLVIENNKSEWFLSHAASESPSILGRAYAHRAKDI